MQFFKILVVALFMVLIINHSASVEAEGDLKTDVKIITSLSASGFFTPALVKNNSLVYNKFEFHLYSNINIMVQRTASLNH